MKFGKFLLASRVIGWEEYYIDYKHPTRTIKVAPLRIRPVVWAADPHSTGSCTTR